MVFKRLSGLFGSEEEGGTIEPRRAFESQHVTIDRLGPVLHTAILSETVSDREAQIVFNEVNALIDEGCAGLIVDLKLVTVFTSAGIGAMVRLHHRLDEVGGRLALCSANEELSELFRLTRMDRLFALAPDRDAALRALRA